MHLSVFSCQFSWKGGHLTRYGVCRSRGCQAFCRFGVWIVVSRKVGWTWISFFPDARLTGRFGLGALIFSKVRPVWLKSNRQANQWGLGGKRVASTPVQLTN